VSEEIIAFFQRKSSEDQYRTIGRIFKQDVERIKEDMKLQ
jgi:hypothetical protein